MVQAHDVVTAVSLLVCSNVFSVGYLGQRPTRYDALAFALIVIAVAISLFQPHA